MARDSTQRLRRAEDESWDATVVAISELAEDDTDYERVEDAAKALLGASRRAKSASRSVDGGAR